jgi:DNA replication and repair protein RecF
LFKVKGSRQELKERALAAFGSRGEQRMGVLWLKMAELSFIEEKSGERPTLLLDDIFSELDEKHRSVVVDVAKRQQTIITSVNDEFTKDLKKVEKIKLEE